MALIEFKEFENPPKEVTIRGWDGNSVTVRVKPLSGRGQNTVLWALDQIKTRYQPEVFDVPIDMIMGAAAHTGFLESKSLPVGAYSWGNDTDNMLIVFAEKLLLPTNENSKQKFAVTLLHELMHFLLDEPDFTLDDAFEARLDLDCYRALGFPIPADHWGLRKPGIDPAKPE